MSKFEDSFFNASGENNNVGHLIHILIENHKTPYDRLLGVEFTEVSYGKIVCHIDPEEAKHANSAHIVHGGVHLSLLDMALGFAVITTLGKGNIATTTSLNTNFHGAGRFNRGPITAHGEFIKISTCLLDHILRPRKSPRTYGYARGYCTDSKGRVLSTAHGKFRVTPKSVIEKVLARE